MCPVKPIAYIPCSGSNLKIPFERFLPLFPTGVIQVWLKKNAEKLDWVLDPLGTSPLLALEAASMGCRVLVASNNPVTAFELQIMAAAPSREMFSSVLAELAQQKKGAERLENFIGSLYLTRCASCGLEIQAEAFIWRRGELVPYGRIYSCHHCGDSGEHPVTDEDILRLQPAIRADRMHRTRALERVLAGNQEDRDNVNEALSMYPSRSLYALFTLLNKIEGMDLPTQRRQLLEALMLSIMDAASSLWAWPEERQRPRQLSIPATYIEKNIWLEMERAVETWSQAAYPAIVSVWPEIPIDAGICLFPGRMRELTNSNPNLKIGQILCVFPRPNQAFWTLSSLWSSWLWGQEKAARVSTVLDRRRFDWYWHTTALHSALAPASRFCGENVRTFGVIPEPAAGLVTAVIESASVCGYTLTGSAVKNAEENIQLEWKTGSVNREFIPVNIQKVARESIRDLMQELGEPTEYLEVHTAAMCALADQNAFPPSIQHLTYEKAVEINSVLTKLLNEKDFLRRLDATSQDLESGLWWLSQPDSCQTPLADRLEMEITSWLQAEGIMYHADLLTRVNQRFPGYLTPPDTLIRHCLESYADFDANRQRWILKPNESHSIREKDIADVRDLLHSLALRFDLVEKVGHPVTWFKGTSSQTPIYRFYISSSAVIDRAGITALFEGCETVFILPGSRAGLLKLKLDRDPYLRDLLEPHWHFLKYRTLRGIANRPDLTLDLWTALMDSDPVSLDETTQLSMFL